MNSNTLRESAGALATAARYHNDLELAEEMGNLSVGGLCAEDWIGSCTSAAVGRPTTIDPDQCAPCPVKPPRCDCHVIGGNTLGTTGLPTGVTAAARFGRVQLDSGDAGLFIPYYIFVTAFQLSEDTTIVGPPLMVLLADSKSGQEPNLRRASTTDPSQGVFTLIYGREKELECVDWRRFSSTNNQQLNLTFYNPQDFAVHVFVALWGIPAA